MTDEPKPQDVQGVVERLRALTVSPRYPAGAAGRPAQTVLRISTLEEAISLLLSEHEGRVRAEAWREEATGTIIDLTKAVAESFDALSSSQAQVGEMERALTEGEVIVRQLVDHHPSIGAVLQAAHFLTRLENLNAARLSGRGS